MRMGFIAANDLAGLEQDAHFARAHGFDGLEFNFWGEFKDLTADRVKAMRAVLDKSGVAAASFGIWGWNHLDPDPGVRQLAHGSLRRAIEFGHLLGAEVLITGGGQIPNATPEQNAAAFCQTFPPFVALAREAGLQLAMYPVHGNSFFRTIDDFRRVWVAVPDVGIKLDPANIRHAGGDYLRLLRDHGDKVYHLHVKEHLYLDGELVSQPPAGMGDIQWGKVMALLYEKNYRGYLSIEPHGPVWSRPPLRYAMLRLSQRHIAQFLLR